MRRTRTLTVILSMALFTLCLSGCSSERSTNPANDLQSTSATESVAETELSDSVEESAGTQGEGATMKANSFYVEINGKTFTATFADNASAEVLKEILKGKDVTIRLRDYAGNEKVGALGEAIPRDDTNITTSSGDIVLYDGNQIVIFYGSNTWSYTKLGSIDDLTGWSEALGSGDVSVTLSI